MNHASHSTSPGPPLFGDYAEECIQRWAVRPREPITLRVRLEYERMLERDLRPVWGDRPLDAIRRSLIETWVSWLSTTGGRSGVGRAPRTLRNIAGLLSAIMNQAERDDLISRSPCRDIGSQILPAITDGRPDFITWAIYRRDEMRRWCWDRRLPPVWQMLARLAFCTGMRQGEILDRRFRDFRKHDGVWVVDVSSSWCSKTRSSGPTKTGVARLVPLHPQLLGWIWRWRLGGFFAAHGRRPGPDDLVISRRNGSDLIPLEGTGCTKRWRDLCGSIGVEHRTFHATRATFISLAQEDGAAPLMLERITHASAARGRQPPAGLGLETAGPVFDRYSRFSLSGLATEVAKLRIAPITEGRGQEVLE